MKWGPEEKGRLDDKLAALGWERDDFARRRGFPQRRRGSLLARFDEDRTVLVERIVHEEHGYRRCEHVATIRPEWGRGWVDRMVSAIQATLEADGEASPRARK